MSGDWAVTMTTFSPERKWSARFEWIGAWYVFSLQISPAPSMRIVVCGWSFWCGKIMPPPKIQCYTKMAQGAER